MEKTTLHQSAEPFLASVESVREAESKAENVVKDAEAQAGGLLAASREKAVEIGVKASDDAVSQKNSIIAKGRAETQKIAEKILGDAREKSQKIASKKLSQPDANEIASGVKI